MSIDKVKEREMKINVCLTYISSIMLHGMELVMMNNVKIQSWILKIQCCHICIDRLFRCAFSRFLDRPPQAAHGVRELDGLNLLDEDED